MQHFLLRWPPDSKRPPGADPQKLLNMQAELDQQQQRLSAQKLPVGAYVPSFLKITAKNIEQWVEKNLEARFLLPVLLRKLVNSTGLNLSLVDFPGYDGGEEGMGRARRCWLRDPLDTDRAIRLEIRLLTKRRPQAEGRKGLRRAREGDPAQGACGDAFRFRDPADLERPISSRVSLQSMIGKLRGRIRKPPFAEGWSVEKGWLRSGSGSGGQQYV
jgi:hypothetical protein